MKDTRIHRSWSTQSIRTIYKYTMEKKKKEKKKKRRNISRAKMIILRYITSPILNRATIAPLSPRAEYVKPGKRFVCMCVCVCVYLCIVYNRNPRRRGDFCSQPYLTSSQSCYINKNRDFARFCARFEKSAKKLRAKTRFLRATGYFVINL